MDDLSSVHDFVESFTHREKTDLSDGICPTHRIFSLYSEDCMASISLSVFSHPTSIVEPKDCAMTPLQKNSSEYRYFILSLSIHPTRSFVSLRIPVALDRPMQ